MAMQPSEQQGSSNHAEPPGLSENIIDEDNKRRLFKAAVKGDWETAEIFFQARPNLKTANITSRSETVLHIAVLNAQDHFVEKLVEHLFNSGEALDQVDCDGRTALHHAVLCGRIRMVKALVTKNQTLTQMPDFEGRIPFNLSTLEASMHKDIAWFLAKKTEFTESIQPNRSPHAIQCTVSLTWTGHLDIVLHLLSQYPSLILMKGPGETGKSILGMLARMPSHFRSGTSLGVLETLIYKCIPVDDKYRPTDANSRDMQTSRNPALQCLTRSLWNAAKIAVPSIKRIDDMKQRHEAAEKLVEEVCKALSRENCTEITNFFHDKDLLGQATMNGISELVKLSIQYFPELIWNLRDEIPLMTLAVQYRHDKIVRLFLKESSTNGSSPVPAPTERESNMMMCVASKYYHVQEKKKKDDFQYITLSGAALQMQRELQWFKAVESWVGHELRATMLQNKTYWEQFVENHEKLLENGQKWVKETADKCMLVSTLIATVLFAAIFTVPGTNNDSNIILLKGSVLIFTIFDGLGLFSSVAATLQFLAILTSPNEPQDFLDSLPKKIILGLLCLFLSLVFMLVAFAATLTCVLDKTMERVLIPIIFLASFPLTVFAILQHSLLSQMIKATYGPSIFRSEDIWKQGIIIGRDDGIDN